MVHRVVMIFGAGEANALAAVKATAEVPSPVAVSAKSKDTNTGRTKTGENASETKELPAIRSLDPPVATVASEKSDSRDGGRPAGR